MNFIASALSFGLIYGTFGSLAFTLLLMALLATGFYLSNPYYSYVRWILKTFGNFRLRRLA